MMKKAFLGSTALISAAVFSAPAIAGPVSSGDNYSVTFGGRLDYSISWYSQDISTGKGRGYHFTNDEAEIYVGASATADNGLKYGVKIELNANEDDSRVADEVYGYVDSDQWGRVEMGDNDSAADRMGAYAYDVLAGRGGWDASEWEDALNAGSALIDSGVSFTSDDTKLIYFTPRFAGFQLGASLTPDTGVNGRAAGAVDNDGDTNNAWSVGANYEGEFGDVGVLLAATYETGSRPHTGSPAFIAAEDPEIMSVGAIVSIAGFEVGATYVDRNETGVTTAAAMGGADGGQDYSVGVGYGTGPWKVSVGYYHSEIANGGALADTETDFFAVGATYKMAPGWRIYAEVDVIRIDNQNGAAPAAAMDNDFEMLVITNRFDF